jgi:hypothetical protein
MDLDALAHIFCDETNLAVNPRFDTGALALLTLPPNGARLWSLTAGSGVVATAGIYVLQLVAGDSAAVSVFATAQGLPTSVAVAVGLGPNATGRPSLDWYNAAGASLGSNSGGSYRGTVPAEVQLTAIAPLAAAWGVCTLHADGSAPNTAAFTRVIVSPTLEPLPFFDGDSGGCRWTGQRYWSTSERLGTADELDFMIQAGPPVWSSDSALVTALS